MEESQIGGYIAYYLKQGEPIRTKEGEITEIPVTIDSDIIRPELKEDYDKYFSGATGIPTEAQFKDWLRQAELEECVSCGLMTETPKNQHIDYRNYYVEGAGQLCKRCYDKIYGARMTNP